MHLALAVLLLIIDQASKLWVQRTLPLGEPHAILPPWLYFTHVENQGAAFSLFAGQRWLFVTAATGFVLLAWANRAIVARQDRMFRWGLALGLAGAMGNLIDRVRQGSVIDFLDLRLFPVFNIADSCIVIGCGLILWSQLQGPTS
ncbi:MAG: signal peptidase II [Limnochordia bacterium]